MDTIENPGGFLKDHGILFEINRQILHPIGMELRFDVDDEGELRNVKLLDNRSVGEPIYFSPEDFLAGRAKYEQYLKEHGRRNIQKRRRIGMVIQTGPTTHPSIMGEEPPAEVE